MENNRENHNSFRKFEQLIASSIRKAKKKPTPDKTNYHCCDVVWAFRLTIFHTKAEIQDFSWRGLYQLNCYITWKLFPFIRFSCTQPKLCSQRFLCVIFTTLYPDYRSHKDVFLFQITPFLTCVPGNQSATGNNSY